MNTAGSSQRSPSLPTAGDGSVRTAGDLGIEQKADPDDRTVISQRPPLPSNTPGRPTSPFELGKLLAGERLNHFELREYVGGGGMGAVFRALDTMLNREVALKVLSRDQGADEETRRRFQNEAQSAARLDHENIARVFYVGEDKGLNYIVFEFIEGVNLRDFVEQRGPLPLAETISYTLQIADALSHASSRDVVHRDIKPSNVIITGDGRAKLVDMGLARLHQVKTEGEDLTASGVTLGTFDYISPEQARDPRSADVRSDIYSLGCTVYFMLTGRPPFPEGTVLQKLLQHNSDAPPDPRELNPDLPEELSEVIRKMLAKDPRRRFQHPSELIAELYLLAERIGCPAPNPARPAWLAPPSTPRLSSWQRHLPWIIPVAALLVIVALLDRWHAVEPSEEEPQNATQGESISTGQPVAIAETSRKSSASKAKTKPSRNSNGAAEADSRNATSGVSPTGPAAERLEAPSAETDQPEMDAPSDSSPPAGDNGSPTESGSSENGEKPSDNSNASANAKSVEQAAEGDSKTAPTVATPADSAEPTSSNPASGKPAGDAASAKPAIEELPPGLLAVCDEAGPQRYSSLSAACAAAKSGDVIELRYNGRRAEEPISLANHRLTIRSKDGFQPVIIFRPSGADPYNYPHSMLHVAGGTLKLVNVAIELEMPRSAPSENWSLLEAQLVESLTLEKCLLTIKNASDQLGAYHDKVSFFHLKAAPGADAMMPKGMMSVSPTEIRLEDCAARGEASFLRIDDAQPVRLTWKNGLLIASEWLLSAGGATTAPSTSGGTAGKIRLELAHLTAVTGQGLFRMSNSYSAPALLDADIRCTDSILMTASASAPLIEQACVEEPSESQRRIRWEGDRNTYSGFSAFWRIGEANAAAAQTTLPFEEWKRFWSSSEVQPSIAPIAWKRPAPVQLPPHARTAADYAIDDRLENAAIYDTSDGALVGVNAAALPEWLWQTDRDAETPDLD